MVRAIRGAAADKASEELFSIMGSTISWDRVSLSFIAIQLGSDEDLYRRV
jgi:hypothetical protein